MQELPDPQFVIRRANPTDVVSVKALEIEAGLSPWSTDAYRKETERDGSVFFVALHKGTDSSIGFLVMRLITISNATSLKPDFHFEGEVLNIAVSKAYQRRGIATALLKRAIQTIPDNVNGSILLEVRESNIDAIRFYEKFGFLAVGRRRAFYSTPVEDAILLRLQV